MSSIRAKSFATTREFVQLPGSRCSSEALSPRPTATPCTGRLKRLGPRSTTIPAR